ncbi:MAG: single-stranded DNA-binding protein [Pseudomonadota bacterium]|nr:single-stranded DNA-binding protein [Pseudomonadota bacterium]
MSNVISFSGICGSDSEVRYLQSGQAVLTVNVACNVGFGDKQQTMWFRCAVWGKRAEGQLKDYLKKGQHVFVSGEMRTNEYQAKDGTTKTSLELNANIIDLIGKKSEGQQQAQSQNSRTPQESRRATPSTDNFDDFDDDIPFIHLNAMIKGHLI